MSAEHDLSQGSRWHPGQACYRCGAYVRNLDDQRCDPSRLGRDTGRGGVRRTPSDCSGGRSAGQDEQTGSPSGATPERMLRDLYSQRI